MSGEWLYRYEVKGIQDFIMATDKLREMKGASSLIVELGDLFTEASRAAGLGTAKMVEPPVAGGATMLVNSDDRRKLDAFMAGWPVIVARHAPGLRLVQALVPKEDGFDELHRRLRADRSRHFTELPEAGPLVMRAPRTGLPATELGTNATDEGRKMVAMDPASHRKAVASSNDRLGQRLDQSDWVDNLEEITHSYLAVVHADGNDIGRRKKEVLEKEGQEELLSFSRKLSGATLSAVKAAIEEVLVPARRKDGRLPARPIVVGGDDVTFIIRADLAFDFTLKLLEAFEKESGDLDLHACAGIAYVHLSHPFHLAHCLAEELCEFTKENLRGRQNGITPSGLSFYRLTTSISEAYDELRRKCLLVTREGGKRLLSMCPYTVGDVPGFPRAADIRELSKLLAAEGVEEYGLPSGPVREFVGLMLEDGNLAEKRWQRFRTVQKQDNEKTWEKTQQYLEALGVNEETGWAHWSGQGEWEASPWLDAMTLNRTQSPE